MALNWISSRAGSVLPLIGIVLALANWNARPDAAWAWAAAIVMFLVMVAVRRHSQLAFRRSSGDAASVRSVASVTGAVVFGGLMMIIPLAVTLAHAYGVVDDPDSGRRMTMIILGAYLVVTGNAIPKTIRDGVVDAVRRRPSTGVSAVCRLDVGALRSRIRDGVARTADRRGGARVDGPRGYRHDRHDRATATPSQAAAARWRLNRPHNPCDRTDGGESVVAAAHRKPLRLRRN